MLQLHRAMALRCARGPEKADIAGERVIKLSGTFAHDVLNIRYAIRIWNQGARRTSAAPGGVVTLSSFTAETQLRAYDRHSCFQCLGRLDEHENRPTFVNVTTPLFGRGCGVIPPWTSRPLARYLIGQRAEFYEQSSLALGLFIHRVETRLLLVIKGSVEPLQGGSHRLHRCGHSI